MTQSTLHSFIEFCDRAIEIACSDHVVIHMYGDAEVFSTYKKFTSPHHKMPLLASKYFGAALFRLPDAPDEYLRGGAFELARRKCRQAVKAGFSFCKVGASDYVEDILAINRSLPVRQGRPMDSDYLEEETVRTFCNRARDVFAVVGPDGRLAGYTHAPICGEVFLFSRLLGHGAFLRHGIMYLLITETIREMIHVRQRQGYPVWAQYDMFLGATPGLAQFKRSLGFRPYRVTWQWRD
jgi:hypothetical protein